MSALEKMRQQKAAKGAGKTVTKKLVSVKNEETEAPAKRKLNTSALTAPKKEKEAKSKIKITKKVEKEEEVDTPSIASIKTMRENTLNTVHSNLPDDIDEWDNMGVQGKRDALIEAFYGEQEVPENEAEPETSAETETDAELEAPKSKVKLGKKAKVKARGRGDNSGDLIEQIVGEVENLTEEEADAEVTKLSDNIEENYFRIGGVLNVIKEQKYFGEYDTFEAKVEAEFGMKRRKAYIYIELYKNISDSGVSWDKLKEIGWSKLHTISHLINEDNIDDWLEKAEHMNVTSLQDEVKAQTAKGETTPSKAAPKNTTKTMTFKVHEDQQETINEALEKAMEAAGTDSKTVALEGICADYLAGGNKKTVTRDMSIKEFFKKLLKEADGENEDEKLNSALEALLEGPDFKGVFGVTFEELQPDTDDKSK